MREELARRFEIGQHPLAFRSERQVGPGRYVLEFAGADDAPVTGILLRPDGTGPFPAVLVIHAHGGAYHIGAKELTEGRPAQPSPLGPELLARGIASVCLDMPCFGARAGEDESAAAKAALWRGGSLAGRMMGELSSQVDWLASQGWVDAGRIGVYGLSMGCTLGYWLAAVDGRVAALAQLCCLADFEELIAAGAHDLHGIYLTVPGLLGVARNGQIAGMVSPRPQFVGLGALDPLTPERGREVALADLRVGYAGVEDRLAVMIEPDHGHQETPAMRAAVLAFFERWLQPIR